MRRLLGSLHGGIAATVFLFTLASYLDRWPALSDRFDEVLFWPSALWNHLFPARCFLCLRRFALPFGTHVLLYSSLTYAVLRRVERRQARTP